MCVLGGGGIKGTNKQKREIGSTVSLSQNTDEPITHRVTQSEHR